MRKKQVMTAIQNRIANNSERIAYLLVTGILVAFVATIALLNTFVDETEAADGFSYLDMKGTLYSGQTMVVPSRSEMKDMGLDVSDDQKYARVANESTFIIEEGATLIVPKDVTLLVHGTIINRGKIIVEDYGAILGTPQHNQGVYGVTVAQKKQLPSAICCEGGELIINEKSTVYLARTLNITKGGFVINNGTLMVGKNINIEEGQIQMGSNADIFLGYYFLDMLFLNGGKVMSIDFKPLSLDRLNKDTTSETYQLRNSVLKYYFGKTRFDSMAEASYYITREYRIRTDCDRDYPFYNNGNTVATALQKLSMQSMYVDSINPSFVTKNGSVNMNQGSRIFVAHSPKSLLSGKPFVSTSLFDKAVGEAENQVNIIGNDNGKRYEVTRVLRDVGSIKAFSQVTNKDYWVYK